MDLNWTTVISSAVVATIIGVCQLIAQRYIVRILDNIETKLKNGKKPETNT